MKGFAKRTLSRKAVSLHTLMYVRLMLSRQIKKGELINPIKNPKNKIRLGIHLRAPPYPRCGFQVPISLFSQRLLLPINLMPIYTLHLHLHRVASPVLVTLGGEVEPRRGIIHSENSILHSFIHSRHLSCLRNLRRHPIQSFYCPRSIL